MNASLEGNRRNVDSDSSGGIWMTPLAVRFLRLQEQARSPVLSLLEELCASADFLPRCPHFL